MTLLGRLRGVCRPADGSVAVPADRLRHELLALNRSTAPFVVGPGDFPDDGLVAEWRIVDERWRTVFADAGLTKAARVRLRWDTSATTVRAVDELLSVRWSRRVPTFGTASVQRGRIATVQFGRGWSFDERGEHGEVHRYRFTTGELKEPLRTTVTGCGWTWRG